MKNDDDEDDSYRYFNSNFKLHQDSQRSESEQKDRTN